MLDKRMFAEFVWNLMDEAPAGSIGGRVSSNHKMKDQIAKLQQVHRCVMVKQPDDMKCPEVEEDFAGEITSDVAFQSFFGLPNSERKTVNIGDVVDLQWQMHLSEYYKPTIS